MRTPSAKWSLPGFFSESCPGGSNSTARKPRLANACAGTWYAACCLPECPTGSTTAGNGPGPCGTKTEAFTSQPGNESNNTFSIPQWRVSWRLTSRASTAAPESANGMGPNAART